MTFLASKRMLQCHTDGRVSCRSLHGYLCVLSTARAESHLCLNLRSCWFLLGGYKRLLVVDSVNFRLQTNRRKISHMAAGWINGLCGYGEVVDARHVGVAGIELEF